MRRVFILIFSVLYLMSINTAAQAEVFNLTVSEVRVLLQALNELDCLERIQSPEGKKCKEGGVRFKFKGHVMMTIAKNIDMLRTISDRFERARNGIYLNLPEGMKSIDNTTVEGKEILIKIEEMLNTKQQVDLVKIKESEFELDEGAKNQIPVSVLGSLFSLIEHK